MKIIHALDNQHNPLRENDRATSLTELDKLCSIEWTKCAHVHHATSVIRSFVDCADCVMIIEAQELPQQPTSH